MDEQPIYHNPTSTSQYTSEAFIPQPPTQPVYPPAPKRRFNVPLLIAIAVLVLFIVGGIAAIPKFMPTTLITPTPTPRVIPTPTPERYLSSIASQSAFIQLEANVSSLSGILQNMIISDPSLSPPVLELPLGFSSN